MVVTVPSVVMVAATLILAWLFHRLLTWSSHRNRRRSDVTLPLGSFGLPLLGETLQFFCSSSSMELPPFFKQRLERYGPVFKTNLVGMDLIVSLDPEINAYALQQRKAFHIWFPPDSFKRFLGDENVAASSGSVMHKLMRNMILRTFGPENLRVMMLSDVQRAVNRSLASWLEKPSIELKTAASSMICCVSAMWLMGYEPSTSSEELWKFYDVRGLVSFPLNIPGTAFHRSMQGRKHALKVLKQLLDGKRNTEPRENNKDLIDVMVQELNKEKPLLNEKTALNQLFVLLFASFETTSSAITVDLKFLTDNPKALQELTEEHEQIMKRRTNPNSEITWEEYKSMKFTSCAIHESIRLSNITTVLFRKAKQDVHIKGYTIPEGWILMVCPAAAHQNPITYKDPAVFNPWRWKDISEPVGGSKHFLAFGYGLRHCPGADFAKLQMAIFLHCLVTKYRWKVINGDAVLSSAGLRFPNGFHVQIVPKSETCF